MSAHERWKHVAADMQDDSEAQVMLRNGARFSGKIRGNSLSDTFLHLRNIIDNTVSPARPTVVDHVVEWEEIIAITGTWVGYWTTGDEPTRTQGDQA